MNETLVSCYFNLKKYEKISENENRRRDIGDYMKHGRFILAQPKPLVLFADKDIAVECQMMRTKYGLDALTKIIPMDVEKIPYYHLLPHFIHARQNNPMLNGSPSKDTPLYTLLTWCKFAFIQLAIEENPFRSTHFAWIDFGITHVANTKYFNDEVFSHFPDKIKLLSLRNLLPEDLSPNNTEFNPRDNKIEFVKKHYYSLERGIVAAGLMTGGIKEWKLFYTLFDKAGRKCLEEGFAPSEQQLLPILMLQNPKLFLTYRGDYDAIISNYKYFRMSLSNVNKYTLEKARTSRKNIAPALKVGVEIYKAISAGEYDREGENPVFLLDFLNELYALFIFHGNMTSAGKIIQFYQELLDDEKYKKVRKELKNEFIPLP